MQTRFSDEKAGRLSVRLSDRPSLKRVDCDKIEERSVQIFIPYERSFSLVFCEDEWLVGGDPFYLKFWVNRPLLERKFDSKFITPNDFGRGLKGAFDGMLKALPDFGTPNLGAKISSRPMSHT